MFNNLIESSSHADEFKRRGSFFLFTTVTYALLFVFAGVLSIYAYDARLDEPANEITMLSPLDMMAPETTPQVTHNAAPARPNNHRQVLPQRQIAMARVDQPNLVPPTTSAARNPNLPVPNGQFTIGPVDSDPAGSSPGTLRGSGIDNNIGREASPVEIRTSPPAPVEKLKPKVVHKSVLNGYAVSLPKPAYPPIAKQMRVQGSVNVQVLVDEAGKVVSAKVVSGNPALVNAARTAAMAARFSPTMLGDQAVKVTGVITYNFVLQ